MRDGLRVRTPQYIWYATFYLGYGWFRIPKVKVYGASTEYLGIKIFKYGPGGRTEGRRTVYLTQKQKYTRFGVKKRKKTQLCANAIQATPNLVLRQSTE